MLDEEPTVPPSAAWAPVPSVAWVPQQVHLHPYPKELMLRNHLLVAGLCGTRNVTTNPLTAGHPSPVVPGVLSELPICSKGEPVIEWRSVLQASFQEISWRIFGCASEGGGLAVMFSMVICSGCLDK